MANYSGTYTIPAGPTGTVTSATSNSVTLPTVTIQRNGVDVSKVGWSVEIVSGLGAGQVREITAVNGNIHSISPNWTTTPDGTSGYRICVVLDGDDHFVADTTWSTGTTVRSVGGVTPQVDGNYVVGFSGCKIALGMTRSLPFSIAANNRTVQGTRGFWKGLYIYSATTQAIEFSFIRVFDAGSTSGSIYIEPSAGTGDFSQIGNFWIENGGSSVPFTIASGGSYAITANASIRGVFARNCQSGGVNFNTASSAFTQKFSRFWIENCTSGAVGWAGAAGASATFRDSVVKTSSPLSGGSTINAGKHSTCAYNFISPLSAGYTFVPVGTSSAGEFRVFGNVQRWGSVVWTNLASPSSATLLVSSNDGICYGQDSSNYAIDIPSATAFVTAKSDNDLLAGHRGASVENIDTTTGATSTASPQQYRGLTTNRTNPRTTPNFPLAGSDPAVSLITQNSARITFNAASGANANGSQGTTVDQDSASGQAVLYVAATTAFIVGMDVEIGVGTARYEVGTIASIDAGNSITLAANLTYSHTASDADGCRIMLRLLSLPVVRWGTADGVYTEMSALPPRDSLGPLFTDWATDVGGKAYEWKRTGHIVDLNGLTPGTTIHYQVGIVDPDGNMGFEATDRTFTTTAAPSGAGGPPRAFDVGFD